MRKKTGHQGQQQRNHHHSNNNNNNNRSRGKYRSNGNDGQSLARQKKQALTQKEKYLNMARDALSNGERVDAEYYYQHVEHYARVVGDILEKEGAREQRNNQSHNADNNSNASDNDEQDDNADSNENTSEASDNDKAEAAEDKPKKPARQPRTRTRAAAKPKAKKEADDEVIPLPTSILPAAVDEDSVQA